MNAKSLIRALVLGDVMLDLYTRGRADRLSPEAPVPVFRLEKEEARLGGAGAVATLLAALETQPIVAGIVGDDPAGAVALNLLAAVGSALRGVPLAADHAPHDVPRLPLSVSPSLPPSSSRPTTVKQRFLAHSTGRPAQPLLRVDRESCAPLTGQDEDYLLAAALAALETAHAVLISDYGKGVCTPTIARTLVRAAWKRELPVLVDPRRGADYGIYRWATVIKPNRYEASEATGRAIRSRTDAFAAGKELCKRWGFRAAVITLDADGLVLVTSEGLEQHFTPHRREVIDVTGAGDTVLAVLGAALARGRSLTAACQLATLAAGLQVERVGVSGISWREIEAASGGGREGETERRSEGEAEGTGVGDRVDSGKWVVDSSRSRCAAQETWAAKRLPSVSPSLPPSVAPSLPPSVSRSLRLFPDPSALFPVLTAHRSRGQRIVFTNGCFDLLHVGHIHCLSAAKALGDVLIVAVNSDASVRWLKGASRPIVGERDRAAMLAALACVDYVTIFDEDTPERLIASIRPDVLVKGAESRPDGIAGAALVASYGGRVELVPFLPERSTSSLVTRLRSVGDGVDSGQCEGVDSGQWVVDSSRSRCAAQETCAAKPLPSVAPSLPPSVSPSHCPSLPFSSLCVLACAACEIASESSPPRFDYDSLARGALIPNL